jgi:hypothetical protein
MMMFGVHGGEKITGDFVAGLFCWLRQCMNRLLLKRRNNPALPN